MAASLRKCVSFLSLECQRFTRDLRIIASILQNPGNGLGFDTAAVSQPCIHQSISNRKPETTTNILDSIFSNVLLAVQRNRRTLERRMTRRMQMAGHFEYAIPRVDIVADLDTGRWKEKGTICKHHYARVKEEMKQMQEELGEAMQYTADQKEVVFLYEGEESKRPRHDGKYIVEMKKQRPAWFAKNLLQKRNS